MFSLSSKNKYKDITPEIYQNIIERSRSKFFYLNMDNKYALNYLRNVKDSEIELVKNHYEIAFLLVSMSLIKEHESEDSEITLLNYTKNINRALSPIMLDLARDIIQ